MGGRFATRVGRRPRPTLSVQERRSRARDALVAAGTVEANYDLSRGGLLYREFLDRAFAAGHVAYDFSMWPTEESGLADGEYALRERDEAIIEFADGSVGLVGVGHGWARVNVAAATSAPAVGIFAQFQGLYPPAYLVEPQDGTFRVPITFWMNGNLGAYRRLRKIESATWAEIDGNYSASVHDELARLMSWQDGPDTDGQLLLWQGPPGTGKSWALRALAGEWADWAEFHYITDPDAFFVTAPSYMVEVLLSESYDAIEQDTGDVVSADPLGKWRVLILEDTGELLAADSKDNYGQGLSRLLNVVDGMIGQGLRVLAIVTTNDELGDLHPAVTRPGRCASQIEFGPLSAEEASAWLGFEVEEGGTVAELYALRRALAQEAEPDEVLPDAEIEQGRLGAESRDDDLAALVALASTPIVP